MHLYGPAYSMPESGLHPQASHITLFCVGVKDDRTFLI